MNTRLQGSSWQSGYFKLVLKGSNKQVRFVFKVVWESLDWLILGITTSFSFGTGNDSWLYYCNMFFSFDVIQQVFAALLRSEMLNYLQKSCKNQTSCWHYQVSCLSKLLVCYFYSLRIKKELSKNQTKFGAKN